MQVFNVTRYNTNYLYLNRGQETMPNGLVSTLVISITPIIYTPIDIVVCIILFLFLLLLVFID